MTKLPDSLDVQTEGESEPEKPNRLNKVVFFGSAAAILAFSIWAIATPTGAETVIGGAVAWVTEVFGWSYFLTATIIIVFVIWIAASRYGKTKLGPDHSKPDFGIFSWTAMLFAAGIGIDLMFFAVAGPVTHYLTPPEAEPESLEAAQEAVMWTMFHYGISGWAMYALMGMALGYFAFRYKLPLSIRSALYPIIGKRIYGPIGHAVDLAAVLGTIFGIAVSLGIGVVQLNYGLQYLFGIPQGTAAQIGLIVVAVLMATISAISGVDRGIKRLSQLNIILAIVMMIYIMFVAGPIRTLNALVANVGEYLSSLPALTMNTMAYDQPTEWMQDWTLFFWAWWIAWAPFVGLFLARISRGRTIRQFVAATLIVPMMFTMTFLSVFGNAALGIVRDGNEEFGETTMNFPEVGFYNLLDLHPGALFIAGIATIVGLLFYVTSADSGALVMGNFTSIMSNPRTDASVWLRIFWAAATGLLTMAMLLVGGVDALTNATIIMGLPFSFVMYLIMFGVYKALRVETLRAEAMRTSLWGNLAERTSGRPQRTWKQRIGRAMSYPDRKSANRFIEETVKPALTGVADEISKRGAEAEVVEGTAEELDVQFVELKVEMFNEGGFYYSVWPEEGLIPSFASRPVGGEANYYRFEVFLNEGNQGYDVMGYSKEQLIGDVLDCYERHLEYLRLHRENAGSSPLPEAMNEESPLSEEDTGPVEVVESDESNSNDQPRS